MIGAHIRSETQDPVLTSSATSRAWAFAPWAIIGLGLALYLFRMGQASLWLDEAWSALLIQSDRETFIALVQRDGGSQALYYLVLRAWSAVGSDVVWLRSLSVVFATLSLVLFHLLARRLVDRVTALIALGLLSVNPFVVRYAQEVRGYTLALLLVLVATYALVRAVDDDRGRWWVLHGVAGGLALYAHLLTALILMAHLVALMLRGRQGVTWRHVALSGGILAVAAGPLLWMIAGAAGQADIGGRSLQDFVRVVVVLVGNRGWLANLLMAGFVALSLIALLTHRQDGYGGELWPRALCLCWVAVPLGLAWLLSIIGPPVLYDRYLIGVAPAICLLAAIGSRRLRPEILGPVALVIVLVLSASRIEARAGEVRYGEDWEAVVSHVLNAAQPNDAVVFSLPWMAIPFQYQLAETDDPMAPDLDYFSPGDGWLAFDQHPTAGMRTAPPISSVWGWLPDAHPRTSWGWSKAYESDDLAALAAEPPVGRIWFVEHGEQPDVEIADLRLALTRSGRSSTYTRAVIIVGLERFDPD
jgi:mannosyltransferase